MARPRRATAEAFYDIFADFAVEDQAAALKILEQVHRLAVRASRAPQQQNTPADQLPLVTDTTTGGGGKAAEGQGQQ